MLFTDDPIADYARWDREQERMLELRPECSDCGERVQEDYYYLINDEVICPNCLESGYRKSIDEYID